MLRKLILSLVLLFASTVLAPPLLALPSYTSTGYLTFTASGGDITFTSG